MPKAKAKPRKPPAKPQTSEPPPPVTQCRKCGSTERADLRTLTKEIRTEVRGRPITHCTWRTSKCTACGQHRRDLIHENRDTPDGSPS